MSRSADRPVGAAARAVAGLVLGAVSAVLELVLVALAAPLLGVAAVRSRGRAPLPAPVAGPVLAVTRLERRRLRVLLGYADAAEYGPRQALAYLAQRVPVGLLGGTILALIAFGATGGVRLAVGWWVTGEHLDDIPPDAWIVAYTALFGAILLYIAVQGLVGVVALERRTARARLGPSPLAEYERRIAELATSRAAVVEAIDDERRRIERDLHDGVQQRLVALGMLIGRARRSGDVERARDLLVQAHEESQRALAELREVSWRVYPAALDGEGLHSALETVAERSVLPVLIEYAVPARPPHAVETAAYFVVCEAVTNAAKHAGAAAVRVRVAGNGRRVGVRVEDDGRGGADASGGGLAGLARRVAALDGTFAVTSPRGGPTVVTAELPCG
ncbi:sensor histidine kinase [Actinomadura flavalba]|uniref:sensor histidine kinase n=1 Tax=Actinomadura flavalba TaxID=1120938 RepID=UPI000373CE0D|nr:histidine kinase [Actinomadura flavalba]